MSTGITADNPALRALREGRIVGLANNTALVRRDESRIIIDDSAAPIMDDIGTVTGAVLVFRDVTQQKQVQIRLEESAIELDAIFNNAPAIMMLVDNKGVVHRVNRYSSENNSEFLGIDKPMGEIIRCIHSLEEECGEGEKCSVCELREMILEIFNSGKSAENLEITMPISSENQIISKTFLLSSSMLELNGGNMALITLNDITDKKQLKQALAESENKYRSIIEMAGDAIIFGRKHLTECNRKAVEMFGCQNAEQLQGKAVFELSPEIQPDGENSQKKYSDMAEKTIQGEPQHFHWQFKKTDETLFDAEVSLSKVEVEVDGEPVVLSIIRDVTERRKAENELKERSEELEIFNMAMVDREMRIIEIKEEVNQLCRQLGQKPVYSEVWNSDKKAREVKFPEIF
jgi:PAS domain S-box-containing protein